jgi:energy-coupling factor transporter ATP-binding protein EcfA2
MDSQGMAASSASDAGAPQRVSAGSAVAAGFKGPGASQVTTEVANGGDGRPRSGDDTIVMTAPGHHSATETNQPVSQAESPQADEQGGEPGAEASETGEPGAEATQAGEPGAATGEAGRAGNQAGRAGVRPQPHTRVDARLLEAALLNLRKRIAAIPLVFEIEGSAAAKTERTKLLSQIDDYLLPRVRRSAAPVLVALVGSTGAGKSTLVNSIVGTKVSATGVRRPTTNSPVLACHPDDIDWFAENNFLPTLPRVRQEGLARPGRDGLLVLAASEGMPRGIALLDTPDIDSVVKAHHEFAYQFLDASDLWLFMTSSSRYADGPVWEILQHARDRRASLGVVLSRVPQAHRTELVDHFEAMLDANGIRAADRFVIQETPLMDGMLPPDAYQEIRTWLADTAAHADRRVAVLTQTMSGVLDTFKTRVPKVAAHVEAQVVLRAQLRRDAADAYQRGLTKAEAGLRNGNLLQGEVLARWQDCTASGDLRRRGHAGRSASSEKKGKRARRGPQRVAELNAALRDSLESFIISLADQAAEQIETRWRESPAGALLLADAAAERARGEQVKQIFESAFGSGPPGGPPGPFGRSAPDLKLRAGRAVGAWQDHLTKLGGDRNPEAVSAVVAVSMLGEGAAEPVAALQAQATHEEIAPARTDLLDRIRLLFDEELLGFAAVIEAAGPCDDVAAIRLYQAEYSLEAVR